MEKTKGDGYKLHGERFFLGIGKTFFTVRTITHWKNSPGTW